MIDWFGTKLTWYSVGHYNQVTMVDILSSANGGKKLNNSNYNDWSTRVQFYLLGQNLWDIIDSDNITPPTDDEEWRKWKLRLARLSMFLLL